MMYWEKETKRDRDEDMQWKTDKQTEFEIGKFSVTRFGENLPLGLKIYIFGDFLMVYLEFNYIFSILSQFWMQLGKVSLLFMAKYWAKILQSGHTGHNTERVQKK